jgi:hypothetical protein
VTARSFSLIFQTPLYNLDGAAGGDCKTRRGLPHTWKEALSVPAEKCSPLTRSTHAIVPSLFAISAGAGGGMSSGDDHNMHTYIRTYINAYNNTMT